MNREDQQEMFEILSYIVYRSIYKTAIYTVFRLMFIMPVFYDESVLVNKFPEGKKEGMRYAWLLVNWDKIIYIYLQTRKYI